MVCFYCLNSKPGLLSCQFSFQSIKYCINYFNLDALKDDLNLELVGPYDVLAGKEFKSTEDKVPYSLHYRYIYDPPEFITVLKGDETQGFHIGYYRYYIDDYIVMATSTVGKIGY